MIRRGAAATDMAREGAVRQPTAWVAADLLLYGPEVAGCDATQQEFMETLRADDEFDAGGLLPVPIDVDGTAYEASCSYSLSLQGESSFP